MFKVSLLPDSYRRHLEGKKKVDLISKVALVVLVCLFIVYGGILIKHQLLKSKLSNIVEKNRQLEDEFPALQEYQLIYDDLVSAQKMIQSILPKDSEAVNFVTTVSNITPDYVQITQIDLEDWFSKGICTLNCTVQDYQDYKDYVELFKTEEMQKTVKQVETVGITRTVSADGDEKSVTFTLALSLSNALEVTTVAPKYETVTDDNGEAVTDDNGEVQTTDVANTTAAATDAATESEDGSETTSEETQTQAEED